MKLPDPATVYGLKSTRDNRLRYIGQTQGEPIQRFYKHMASARRGDNGKVPAWIRDEIAAGHQVRQTIIVEHGILNQTERLVIERARASGYDLLNVHNGGGDAVERRKQKPMSLETKAKISAARRGRRHTPETKAKISASWGEKDYFMPEMMWGPDRWLDKFKGFG